MTQLTLVLRPAEAEDASLLFDWVNRPDSLAGKRQTAAPISWETHQGWLTRLLANNAARLWIIESGGRPVGQVRLAPGAAGRRMVDIFILSEARRSGLAHAALLHALAEAGRLWPAQPVYAEVLAGNLPSHGLFRRLGFALKQAAAGHSLYVYQA